MGLAKRTVGRVAVLAIVGPLAGCYGGDPADTVVQDLNVCHTTVVEGIDVSEFQRGIDWNAVHASGREFAVARIGDGTYHDPTFATNWAGMHAAGMIRGAYLFWRPTSDPNAMADSIHAAVGTLGAGDLPVTIDVECMCSASTGSCAVGGSNCASPAAAAANLRTLVNRVAADTGKTPMIYTGTWFWNGGTYLNGAANFPDNPAWISGYITGCVSVPSGWSDWRIWQYSDGTCAGCPVRNTAVPGVASSPSVDRDRFNGTLDDLRNFAGMSTTPDWGAHYVSQSFPLAADGAVMIHAGETAPAYIELRNTGSRAWDGNTRLAMTQPRDHTSPFAGPDWAGPNRPASVTGSVPPGGTFRFAFTLHAPATPGMYDERYGVVEEGVAWFSDPGQGGPPDDQLEGRIVVLPAETPPDAGFPDAGTPDAGMAMMNADSGVADAGVAMMATDAGTVDAARRDVGVVADAGDAGGDDAGDASADDAGDAAPPVALEGQCGCRVGAAPRGATAGWWLALAAVVAGRRRRSAGAAHARRA